MIVEGEQKVVDNAIKKFDHLHKMFSIFLLFYFLFTHHLYLQGRSSDIDFFWFYLLDFMDIFFYQSLSPFQYLDGCLFETG